MHYQKYDARNAMEARVCAATALELECLEAGAADALSIYLRSQQRTDAMHSLLPPHEPTRALVAAVAASVSAAQSALSSSSSSSTSSSASSSSSSTSSLSSASASHTNALAHTAAAWAAGAVAVAADVASLVFRSSLDAASDATTAAADPPSPSALSASLSVPAPPPETVAEANARAAHEYVWCTALLGAHHVYRMLYAHPKYMVMCCKMRKVNVETGEVRNVTVMLVKLMN